LSLPLIIKWLKGSAILIISFVLYNLSFIPYLDEAIKKINQLGNENASVDKILEELKKTVISLGLTNEYRYYILICGLFSAERNIVKYWKDYESVFL
jgi:hypothetical protein